MNSSHLRRLVLCPVPGAVGAATEIVAALPRSCFPFDLQPLPRLPAHLTGESMTASRLGVLSRIKKAIVSKLLHRPT